jgi:hypothetical protein
MYGKAVFVKAEAYAWQVSTLEGVSKGDLLTIHVDPSFPLLKLPLELRRDIYQYALCPRAIFTVREGLRRVRTDRSPHDFGYLYSHAEGDYFEGFAVSSKLVVASPSLYIVNKQISSEVAAVLSPTYTILEQTGHLGEATESTDPAFLSLVKDGRFEFLGNSGAALSFLDNILESSLSSVRSILFTHDCLYWCDDEHSPAWMRGNRPGPKRNEDAWLESTPEGRRGQLRAPFPSFLRQKATWLQEIILTAPKFETRWYCSFAAAEVLFLLDEGLIDTMRLLFTEPVPWDYSIENILIRWTQYGRYMLGYTRFLKQLSEATAEERSIPARLYVTREDIISNDLDVKDLLQRAEIKAIFSLRRKSSMAVGF